MLDNTDMVCYGSDAAEIFKGWEDFKTSVEKMIPAFDSTTIQLRDQFIKIHPSGKVAWFSELWNWNLVYNGQTALLENMRLTGVLKIDLESGKLCNSTILLR